jgi:ElaB/YqjD/DUF883 family membrane-anchored ribosome-binding protein
MNETTMPAGGARPALAAHSKDGSAPRQSEPSAPDNTSATHNASATGNKKEFGGFSENLSELTDKASEGVERVKASVREATGNARAALSGSAREALAEGGRAADQAVEVVRDQPLIAMAITGAICLLFGVLLGRR